MPRALTRSSRLSARHFQGLFHKLAPFCADEKLRFQVCCRVRRGVADGGAVGGAAQVDFEGAAALLRRVAADELAEVAGGEEAVTAALDLRELYWGKVDLGALDAIRPHAAARLSPAVLPPFMATEAKYREYLAEVRAIARLNGFAATGFTR